MHSIPSVKVANEDDLNWIYYSPVCKEWQKIRCLMLGIRSDWVPEVDDWSTASLPFIHLLLQGQNANGYGIICNDMHQDESIYITNIANHFETVNVCNVLYLYVNFRLVIHLLFKRLENHFITMRKACRCYYIISCYFLRGTIYGRGGPPMVPWMVLGGPCAAPRMVQGDHLQLPWMVRGDQSLDHLLCDNTP